MYKFVMKKDIHQIAKLAKLSLTPQEYEHFKETLDKVFAYFDQISAVDTTGVEPLRSPTGQAATDPSGLRPDVVQSDCEREEILANAPQRTGQLFTVPPVV